VSLALTVLAAATSVWLYPAAFVGLVLLSLVMLAVVRFTDLPCGISAGGSAQQATSSASQGEFHESQEQGDCPPDDAREADLAASVSVSLAILGLATALSPWLWPAAFIGLALCGLVALTVVVLTHMPCGFSATPLRTGLCSVKADLAVDSHSASHGENGHGSSVYDGGDLHLASKADTERTTDDNVEADLAASVSVSLALTVLAAATSVWLYPAAFVGLVLLSLVMLAVVRFTDLPCGISAGGSAQQATSSASQGEFHESQEQGDCPPDDAREADLAASVSVSLAILGLATALSPWLWPAAFIGLALCGLVALTVVVLTHMPCGFSATPLRTGLCSVKADLAVGSHSASHGELGQCDHCSNDGDCPPDDCKEADRAALVSVSCAIVTVLVSASSAVLVI